MAGKLKTWDADKGELAGGWEGQKKGEQGEKIWGLSENGRRKEVVGRGKIRCPLQVLAGPLLVFCFVKGRRAEPVKSL